jgi:hypothetical protein
MDGWAWMDLDVDALAGPPTSWVPVGVLSLIAFCRALRTSLWKGKGACGWKSGLGTVGMVVTHRYRGRCVVVAVAVISLAISLSSCHCRCVVVTIVSVV